MGERGSISVTFALILTFVLGAVVAMVVDIGHAWEVRNELQNAADASALAGARSLDGTNTVFPTAVQSATTLAQQNFANGSAVNVPPADIVLGRWDFTTRTFAPLLTPAPQVNAVQVTTRRTAATGTAVATFFAPLVGIPSQDVIARAVAVGGSPNAACGFPLAVPDCSLYDAQGNLACNATLTFNSNEDDVAFTLLSLANPNTGDIECAIARAVGYTPCPKKCDCSTMCNATSTSNGQIRISNGNNFSDDMITYLSWAVANAPPGGLYVAMPVIRTGLTTNCSKYVLTGDQSVDGYVEVHITGATGAPTKSITATVDCTHTSASPPAQGFYGYRSTYVYLTR